MADALPPETQTLYAELLDRLLAEAARRDPVKARGTFVHKTVKGEPYVYFQFSEPGGKTRQLYLGRQGSITKRLMGRFARGRPAAERERSDFERLCAQLLAGGAWSMGPRAARVLEAFSVAGVFEAGGVLVGTHAFGILGNLLGVRWTGRNVRTQDLDLAAISLAARAEEVRLDAPGALDRLDMGFLPVPALDPRHPSTSFKVRGEALRVDFLTPGTGTRPIPLPGLGTSAQPLPYLDYLIENPERAAVVDRGGFLVLVPSPARFALHKVLVAAERPAAFQTKAAKDLAQASELLRALQENRPADIRAAVATLRKRGWERKFRAAWKRFFRSWDFDESVSPQAARGTGAMDR